MDHPCRPSPWITTWTRSMNHLSGTPLFLKKTFFADVLAVTEVKVRLTGLLQNSYNLSNLFNNSTTIIVVLLSQYFLNHHAPFHFHYVETLSSHSVTSTLT